VKDTDGVLLAANTARSQAYAQLLEKKEYTLKSVIILNARGGNKTGISTNIHIDHNVPGLSLFLPDLSIPLKETCDLITDNVIELNTSNVNDNIVFRTLKSLHTDLVIYSGFGGQLVSEELLSLGPEFLHIHSGWLPDYRGSTTIYYSILKERYCGVSALLLSPEIDMGTIIKRKRFPLPPVNIDIDYIYDSAIRADVMIDVLENWEAKGKFEQEICQEFESGNTFYVIHPVLKHIAILSLAQN